MAKGERIKQLRIEKNITQSELAKMLNTTKQTISKYEKGIVTNIPSDRIERLAVILGTTPEYILGWETEEKLEKKQIEVLGEEGVAKVKELASVLTRINKDEGFRNLIINISNLNPQDYENIVIFVNALNQKNCP